MAAKTPVLFWKKNVESKIEIAVIQHPIVVTIVVIQNPIAYVTDTHINMYPMANFGLKVPIHNIVC